MKYLYFSVVLASVLFCAQAAGQQKPPTPTPTPQPQPGPQPAKPAQNAPRYSSPEPPPGPESDREIMLTGRLLMPDGTPPSEMIPISLTCHMSQTAGTSTMSDLKGEFRIPLKLRGGQESDPVSRRIATSCTVYVSIPGFQVIRKDVPDLTNSVGMDLGILVLRPLSKADSLLVSLNGLKAPEGARKEFQRAREDLTKERWDSAKSRLEKTIRIYPEHASAWYELGRLQARRGEMQLAAESYRAAANADPQYLSPRIELALMSATSQRWPEAEERSAAILQSAPEGLPGIYLVHSIACFNQKKLEQAEKSARSGLEQDKSNLFPKLASILGSVLAQKGDKQGAMNAFRQYLEKAPHSPDAPKVRRQVEMLDQP